MSILKVLRIGPERFGVFGKKSLYPTVDLKIWPASQLQPTQWLTVNQSEAEGSWHQATRSRDICSNLDMTPILEPPALPSTTSVLSSAPLTTTQPPKGMRKNGKQWHNPKSAFRPTAGQTTYTKRMELKKAEQATKALEREMKEAKEDERNRRVQAIKDRRKAKEEKERYEKMAEKMHAKLVERRRRREKRNKILNSGK
jgi:rRNA-processing protein CGR1